MRRILAALVMASPLAAHHYPVSHGTFEALPGGARLTLRLATHHFHPALERFQGRRIALKDDAAYDPQALTAYFAGTLALVGPRGEVLPFTVVKQDLDAQDLVVTLEVLAPDLHGWRLRNTVLMELSPRQKNLVTVEGLGARRGLVFEAKAPVLALEAP